MTPPDYSPYAELYAQTRPLYPPTLFARLAAVVEPRHLAWDCATGSGQAALGLVDHFSRVVGTDISTRQIEEAPSHPRVEYRQARAEASGLDDHSVDLVTVASALHWFDLDAFYAEVRRVGRPGAVLAAWTYHVARIDPPWDTVFWRLYESIASYFDPGARLVDERYAGITLPGEPIDIGEVSVAASWDLARVRGFIESWSGTQAYERAHGVSPLGLIADDLAELWGDPSNVRELKWPLYTRVARL